MSVTWQVKRRWEKDQAHVGVIGSKHSYTKKCKSFFCVQQDTFPFSYKKCLWYLHKIIYGTFVHILGLQSSYENSWNCKRIKFSDIRTKSNAMHVWNLQDLFVILMHPRQSSFSREYRCTIRKLQKGPTGLFRLKECLKNYPKNDSKPFFISDFAPNIMLSSRQLYKIFTFNICTI